MNLQSRAYRPFRGSGGDGHHFIGSSNNNATTPVTATSGLQQQPLSQSSSSSFLPNHGLDHQPLQQHPPAVPSHPQSRPSYQQQQQRSLSISSSSRICRSRIGIRSSFAKILNKLTPEKFDKLGDQLISLRLDSIPVLKGVILLIFEKAIEEPKYSSMYAQLCKKLSRELNSIDSNNQPLLSPGSSGPNNYHHTNHNNNNNNQNQNSNNNNNNETNTFCRLLLIKCRDEFDNRLKATERFREKLNSPSFAGQSNGLSTVGTGIGTGSGGQQSVGPHSQAGGHRPRPVLTNLSSLAVGEGRRNIRPSAAQAAPTAVVPPAGQQLQPQHQRKRLSDEEEEQWSLAKSKMLGNMRFICELGRQGLVQENILHVCIKQLVSKRKDETIGSKSEDLECLCQIMKTVGRLLDTEKARKLMDQYFERIVFYSTCRELPSRIRFMLKDVIDLRDTNWQPRRVARENGPRPIGQIREEAAKDLGIDPLSLWDNGTGMLMMAGGSSAGGGRNPSMPGYLNGMMMPPGGPSPGSGGNNFNNQYSQQSGSSSGRLPLYGHPALPLVMNPGQRALDDMGYYANFGSGTFLGTGPGVIREDRHASSGSQRRNQNTPAVIGSTSPAHVQGHMPYRGSSSQDDPRKRMDSNNSGNNSSSGAHGRNHADHNTQSSRMTGQQQQQSLPAMSHAGHNSRTTSSGPAVPVVAKMPPIENISLRPAQNSMVLKPMATVAAATAARNASVSTSGKSSPVSESGSTSGKRVTVNPKQDLLKKVTDSMEDLVTESANMGEVLSRLKDVKNQKNLQLDVLLTLVKGSLSKSDKQRLLILKLVNSMRQQNMLSAGIFVPGLQSLLSQIATLEVDDPLIKTHLSEFAAAFVANKTLSLKQAYDLVVDHFPMFLLMLQHLHTLVGQKELKQLFDASKISLMSVLPPDDRKKEQLSHILEKRKLSFLQPLLSLQLQLEKMLENRDTSDPTHVHKWIKETVPDNLIGTKEFIIVLYSCVVRHIIRSATESDSNDAKAVSEAEKDGIRNFRSILSSFVAKSVSLQLTALYAVQSVCHELSFPKGMILRWFNNLYDQEIIDEEIFLRWKEDLNDDFPGKGQALFQVNAWLIWLETEADSEDEDEDDDDEDPDSLSRK